MICARERTADWASTGRSARYGRCWPPADGRHVSIVRPDGESVTELEAGTIVAVTAPNPRVQLAAPAQALGIPYVLIGDALAPRVATDAFREGEVAALQL
jgi:hypothetical protein